MQQYRMHPRCYVSGLSARKIKDIACNTTPLEHVDWNSSRFPERTASRVNPEQMTKPSKDEEQEQRRKRSLPAPRPKGWEQQWDR